MKKIAVAFVLFFAIQHLCVAQNSITKKKPVTVKDLNKSEAEKIKALIILGKPLISKDTSVNNKTVVPALNLSIARKNTLNTSGNLQKDTIERNEQPPAFLNETGKQRFSSALKLSAQDSLLLVKYEKNKKTADSIKSIHKHWLDSTLSVLPAKKPVIINADDEIEIFITGGGLFTGVNPTIYNRLTIYNSGLVHKETKTKLQGESVEDKKIPKDALRKLAQYIIDLGFFDFNNLYDCDAKDKACNTRLKTNPEPTPLSIVVSVGARRKKIYVALYAPHMESNWVNYPANLEKIVNAIYDVAAK
ncbi:MAG: hypothetical protein U0T69_00365 [Chitinophagales bacterium]